MHGNGVHASAGDVCEQETHTLRTTEENVTSHMILPVRENEAKVIHGLEHGFRGGKVTADLQRKRVEEFIMERLGVFTMLLHLTYLGLQNNSTFSLHDIFMSFPCMICFLHDTPWYCHVVRTGA